MACYLDPNEPLVEIQKNQGWQYPDRACGSGEILYSRHFAADACTGVAWTRDGNALFNIIDPATGLADENLAAWRCPGGPILTFLGDNPDAHNIDVVNGDGLIGEGRASGVAALGGELRQGELNSEVGFETDVMTIQSLVQAVVSNVREPVGVPAIPAWGAVVMVILLLTAGTIVLRWPGSRSP